MASKPILGTGAKGDPANPTKKDEPKAKPTAKREADKPSSGTLSTPTTGGES